MSGHPGRAEISRMVSRALRQVPGDFGLVLSTEGWVPVDEVLSAPRRLGEKRASGGEAMLQEVLDAAVIGALEAGD